MQLTEEQRRIVHHSGGHARVSAVAGSGKTTTMVARIGHLLREGCAANQLLVLMFNKSARDSFAESMARNLAALGCPLPEVRTFHSLGLRLTTSFTKRGALPAFRLITEDYILERLARQVMNEVYRRQHDNEGWPSAEDLEEFLTFLDRVKSTVLSADKVFKTLALPARYDYFVPGYEVFEQARRERKIRFFADLIHEPLMAMRADRELAAWVADRVEHIIVDEYQDINEAQQQLLQLLAGRRAKVMVVGDVDQCIYEWRGAQPEFITTRFQQDFPKPANYLLSYTFRYGHQLSLAANHLIANNLKRDRKFCLSHPSTAATELLCLPEADKLQIAKTKTKDPVLAVLTDWQQKGRRLGEAAVLVRLFAQSVPVELALLESGIPYRLEGNQQVFDCPEVLALTGYLQFVLGKLTNEERSARTATLAAMLSQPHVGLKREELESLAAAIAEDPPSAPALLSTWGGYDLPPFVRKKLFETADNWRYLAGLSASGSGAGLLKKIVDRLQLYEFYDKFSARTATAENRVKTCQAFIGFAAGQQLSARELLEKIAELRTVGRAGAETLLITSVHRAKGLEWPLVILPGLEEGSFPFFREKGETAELEDERRLFYVAMTRAIEKVVFIHPPDAGLQRCLATGSTRAPAQSFPASRFLYEANPGLSARLGRRLTEEAAGEEQAIEGEELAIAAEYLKRTGKSIRLSAKQAGPADPPPAQAAPKILQPDEMKEGLSVFHPVFGAGTITAVMDKKAGRLKVRFAEHGETILLAAYARLQTS